MTVCTEAEIIIDSFAGGGGASTGIEWATGRSPDIAINHNAEALAMHRLNHPDTKHYCEDVWQVDHCVAVPRIRARRLVSWLSFSRLASSCRLTSASWSAGSTGDGRL